jgi:hypothetical protein
MRSSAALICFCLLACEGREVAPEGPPGPRETEHGALAFDEARRRLVFYGGQDPAELTPLATTWEHDGTDWTRVLVFGPGPLVQHAMAYDAARKKIVLYGGFGGASSCERTWEYDGIWRALDIAGPGCKIGHSMTYDPARREVILFDGEETWSFSGTLWGLIVLPTQ